MEPGAGRKPDAESQIGGLTITEAALKVWHDREDRLLRLRLSRPKANLIDLEMITALDAALDEHQDDAKLLAVLLDQDGPNFSFGASVEEHLPDQCAGMLKTMHRLIMRMVDCPVPILVSVSGYCLGGGLEVASAGHLIFAAPGTTLGQPEIKLAVFAPAASCLLAERIGQARAEDLLFSGRNIDADEALKMGLVNAMADDPEAAALEYFDTHLSGLSARSLRFAVQAVRDGYAGRIREKLARLESLYLTELMSTPDAVEGLKAFMEKRPAKWEHE